MKNISNVRVAFENIIEDMCICNVNVVIEIIEYKILCENFHI